MNIQEVKKGNKIYFYLKHNIKKNNKIKTFSKYLGNKIPKDILKIKKEFYNEINFELFKKLDLIKKNFQIEWKKIPEIIKKKELKKLSIIFTYNTNKIEGSKITLIETKRIINDNFSPEKNLNDVIETKNHSKIFLEILKNKNKKIDKKFLLKIHKIIFCNTKKEIAGIVRNYDVRIGNYYAPSFKELEKLLKNFYLFIKNSKHHPIEFCARVHYIFEKIHPFGDGNGRVGRLLINYILWQNNFPMIIIENKKKKSYYKALEKTEQNFVNYFLKLYLKVHTIRYLKK